MNIRPKLILFALSGVKFTPSNAGGKNWKSLVFDTYKLHILDMLQKYGESDDYGYWLNEMQDRHSKLYKSAGNNWQNVAYKHGDVGKYQQDYRGGFGNDNKYQRFGSTKLNDSDNYNFNSGIANASANNRYDTSGSIRYSGDNKKLNYKIDNLYSAETDDRRILGRKGDFTDLELNDFNEQLKKSSWEVKLNPETEYYMLHRLPKDMLEKLFPKEGMLEKLFPELKKDPFALNPEIVKPALEEIRKRNNAPINFNAPVINVLDANHRDYEDKTNSKPLKSNWFKNLSNYVPDLINTGRLAGTLINNEKVAEETLKGIRPSLRQTYNTYRQVVGDEATKLAYYRRGAEQITRAARPFTADADKQMAYMMEAYKNANELKAQGDLADNAEIRRTSDESNQHQWANAQRQAEVANANIAELNRVAYEQSKVRAAKQLADWSSWDNYLQGIEYRQRLKKAERDAKREQANLLDYENSLLTDKRLAELKKDYQDAVDLNLSFEEQKKRADAYRLYLNQLLKNYLLSAKQGASIKYTKKDDLLYKQTKDVVKHFREMYKILSRSKNKRDRIEKLTPHPKKFQEGGVAPFYVYRPVAVGGETTRTGSSDSTGSTKSDHSSKDSTLNVIKDLFQNLKGIPIDTNVAYVSMSKFLLQKSMLGEKLSSDDLASMYLKHMKQIGDIEFNKGLYDKAYEHVISNDAMNEYAVDSAGRLVVQGDDGKLSFKSLNQLDKDDRVLSNGELLNLRATSPQLAFNNDVLNIVQNGIGITKIADYIKGIVPKLGTTETSLEGYTKKESLDIISGILQLRELGASLLENGLYKGTLELKSQARQAQMAVEYVMAMLPKNMQSVLTIRAAEQHTTPGLLVATMVGAGADSSTSVKWDAVTGLASSKKDGTNSQGLEINSAVLLLSGMSSPREFTFSIGNGNMFHGLGRVSSINNVEEVPFGADFSYSEIYKSSLRKNLDLDNACFGDVPINKALKDQIVVDNSTIVGIDLPYRIDDNGRIIPDFLMLNRIEEADKEIMLLGIDPDKEPLKVNEIYAKHNLPIKYGANNQLTGNYKRFAVIQATAIEDVFLNKDGLASNGTLELVSDEQEVDKYLRELVKNTGQKSIDLDRPGWFTGNKDIYKGSIFIPIIGDLTDAITGSKTGKLTENNYDEYRNAWNTKNYLKPPTSYVKL